MKIVTTTSVFPPCYPVEEAIDRLSKLGYSGLDLALDYCVNSSSFPFMTDNWVQWGRSLTAKAAECGVVFTHSHAPSDASDRSQIFLRCFDLCGIMGIPYIVVHPLFRNENNRIIESNDEFLSVNTEAILPLLEFAERNHVKILSENLLWGASKDPLMIAKLVKEVNSPYFGWCFDTGHAHCFNISTSVLLNAVVCPDSLHIHDNNGYDDAHLIPGDGSIDWKSFLDTLRSIDYQGEFVLEAHHQSLESKDEERESVLQTLYSRSGKMLAYYHSLC